MRLAAGVEYCGSGFRGWQRQPGQRTVQGWIESALSRVADHPVAIQCAGRTDTGVHAVRQVIHFDTVSQRESHSWILGTNSNLPQDVRITWIKSVEEAFHARFSALARRYKYLIINRPVPAPIFHRRLTWEYRYLDIQRMVEAAADLIGEHDFSSYRAVSCQAKSPVRNISRLDVSRTHDLVVIDIEANAFLHHMVRNIAGVLMIIGAGEEPAGWAKKVLQARDRTKGGITAPPDGLYLADIRYDKKFGIPPGDGETGLRGMLAALQNSGEGKQEHGV